MFLIAGEALIDMVNTPEGTYRPVPGGAPFNFARALALQDIGAGYLNPFSDDAFGALLKRTLEDSGALHLGHISHRPTGLRMSQMIKSIARHCQIRRAVTAQDAYT